MRASRLLSLLMLLQTNGRMTAQELAEQLEVSPRTIYRDMDALSAAGVPVYAERGPHGGCDLLDHYRTTLTGLTAAEVEALFMMAIPSVWDDLGLKQTAEAARLKLTASLPAPFQEEAQRVQQLLYLDAAGWFQPPEPTPYLELVQQAVWEQRRLRITYRLASGEWVKRLISPYGLVGKGGIWYAVAKSGPHLWSCRISRIQEAELTDTHFERPADFDLGAHWRKQVNQFEEQQKQYTVSLRVQPQGWPDVVQLFGEGVYHLSVNGSKHDIIQLHFPNAESACLHLLGLSTAIEIVEPYQLRERLCEIAQRVITHYST